MKSFYVLILLLMFSYVGVEAQTLVFKILEPESAKGRYAVGTQSGWGPVQQAFTGEAAWIEGDSLACDPGSITGNLAGKVAIIRRGTCDFSAKTYQAQLKGAIAAVIIGHGNDGADAVIGMSGAANAGDVTIPAVMVSFNTGKYIQENLDNGIKVVVEYALPNIADANGPFAYSTPLSQVMPFQNMSLKVYNNESTTIGSATAHIEIQEPDGNIVNFTYDISSLFPADSIIADFSSENYTPASKGLYKMKYWVKTLDGGHYVDNDVLTKEFVITDDLFTIDNNTLNDNSPGVQPTTESYNGAGNSHDIGSAFIIPNAKGSAKKAYFSITNPDSLLAGDFFTLALYYLGDLEYTFPTGLTDYNDFELLGVGQYDMQPGDYKNQLHEVDLLGFNAPTDLNFKQGFYLIMAKYINSENSTRPPAYSYTPAYDYPTVNTVVRVGTLYWGGYVGSPQAVVRLGIDLNRVSTQNPTLSANEVKISPTIANNSVNVHTDLTQLTKKMEVLITSESGQPVKFTTFKDVQKGDYNLNVSNLANGVYFMNITTDSGSAVHKFVKAN